jgi:phage-related protein (TIGR01555 family)
MSFLHALALLLTPPSSPPDPVRADDAPPPTRGDGVVLGSAGGDLLGVSPAYAAEVAPLRYLGQRERQRVASVGLGRRIVHGVAALATARGWDVRSSDQRQLNAAIDAELGVRAVFRDALALARQDGVAWVLLATRGSGDLAAPRRDGPIEAIHALSYSEAVPLTWDADPLSPTFSQPATFTVQIQRDQVSTYLGTVHRSHLVRVCGLTIDPTQPSPPDRSGADLSAVEAYWSALADYDLTSGSMAQIAKMISIPWLRSGRMKALAAANGKAATQAEIGTFRRLMGVFGLSVLLDNDEMGVLSPSLAGVRDLTAAQYERLTAIEGAPVEWLTGMRVGGLGSDDAGKAEAIRTYAGAIQDEALAPALAEFYAAALGDDPDRVIVFNPLDEPSESQAIATQKARAEAASIRVAAGITSPTEERALLSGDGPSDIPIDPDDGPPGGGGLDDLGGLTEPGEPPIPDPVEPDDRADAEADTFTPPAAVRAAARRALEVRAQKPPSQRGMTPVGIARARDLAGGRPVSRATLRRMRSFFARHEVDKSGSTWGEQGKGWQAWQGWGGDAGRAWVERVLGDE